MIKNFSFLSLALIGVFFSSVSLAEESETQKIPMQIFVRDGCGHCADQKDFLEENNIDFTEIERSENQELYNSVAAMWEVSGVPITLAGDTIFQGYSGETLGNRIIETHKNAETVYTFEQALENPSAIKVDGAIGSTCEDDEDCVIPQNPSFPVPFFGDIEIKTESNILRYGSSFLLGFLDGFNPCAMWVLIMFIITLIQIGDRMKMMFVAGTFLIAQTIMYGLILGAWWKFFTTIPDAYVSWLNLGVGALAIGAGIFFIYEGVYTDGTCKVTNAEQRKTISQKIVNIANSPISWAAFGGILLLAFSVNVIEFACSAGYPQVFTNILSSISGDFAHKMGLLLTYMFAYMLDDIIVFSIALISIEKLGVTQKYAKATNIFGGVIMLLIGAWMAWSVIS